MARLVKGAAIDAAAVEAEVAGLRDLGPTALGQRWQALTGAAPPPALKGELLRAVLAHRLQEQAFGGLRRDVAGHLAALAAEAAATAAAPTSKMARGVAGSAGSDAAAASRPLRRIRPGSRLLREWQGRMHEVVVTPEGYLWSGETHASLSTIAKRITGTSWNGWRFFGVAKRKAGEGAPAGLTAGREPRSDGATPEVSAHG